MAQTANGLGYWIVRRGGQVYAFGNALAFRPYFASPCDPVVAIIGNPTQQGFRLVTRSGASISRGVGVAGHVPIGTPRACS
jgi:hypothetical protein